MLKFVCLPFSSAVGSPSVDPLWAQEEAQSSEVSAPQSELATPSPCAGVKGSGRQGKGTFKSSQVDAGASTPW
ncbi:MAG: hypothetical protein ACI9HE_000772 [Planctomycetota bacterium]|jgi:hypothetical protein